MTDGSIPGIWSSANDLLEALGPWGKAIPVPILGILGFWLRFRNSGHNIDLKARLQLDREQKDERTYLINALADERKSVARLLRGFRRAIAFIERQRRIYYENLGDMMTTMGDHDVEIPKLKDLPETPTEEEFCGEPELPRRRTPKSPIG